eukprot:370613-Rhodomonas_salina.1
MAEDISELRHDHLHQSLLPAEPEYKGAIYDIDFKAVDQLSDMAEIVDLFTDHQPAQDGDVVEASENLNARGSAYDEGLWERLDLPRVIHQKKEVEFREGRRTVKGIVLQSGAQISKNPTPNGGSTIKTAESAEPLCVHVEPAVVKSACKNFVKMLGEDLDRFYLVFSTEERYENLWVVCAFCSPPRKFLFGKKNYNKSNLQPNFPRTWTFHQCPSNKQEPTVLKEHNKQEPTVLEERGFYIELRGEGLYGDTGDKAAMSSLMRRFLEITERFIQLFLQQKKILVTVVIAQQLTEAEQDEWRCNIQKQLVNVALTSINASWIITADEVSVSFETSGSGPSTPEEWIRITFPNNDRTDPTARLGQDHGGAVHKVLGGKLGVWREGKQVELPIVDRPARWSVLDYQHANPLFNKEKESEAFELRLSARSEDRHDVVPLRMVVEKHLRDISCNFLQGLEHIPIPRMTPSLIERLRLVSYCITKGSIILSWNVPFNQAEISVLRWNFERSFEMLEARDRMPRTFKTELLVHPTPPPGRLKLCSAFHNLDTEILLAVCRYAPRRFLALRASCKRFRAALLGAAPLAATVKPFLRGKVNLGKVVEQASSVALTINTFGLGALQLESGLSRLVSLKVLNIPLGAPRRGGEEDDEEGERRRTEQHKQDMKALEVLVGQAPALARLDLRNARLGADGAARVARMISIG